MQTCPRRLPAKLLPLGNETVIEFLIKRLKIKLIDEIVLATTKKIDDKLIRVAKKSN